MSKVSDVIVESGMLFQVINPLGQRKALRGFPNGYTIMEVEKIGKKYLIVSFPKKLAIKTGLPLRRQRVSIDNFEALSKKRIENGVIYDDERYQVVRAKKEVQKPEADEGIK